MTTFARPRERTDPLQMCTTGPTEASFFSKGSFRDLGVQYIYGYTYNVIIINTVIKTAISMLTQAIVYDYVITYTVSHSNI